MPAPDVNRWNEADSDPLADIEAWKREMQAVYPKGRISFEPIRKPIEDLPLEMTKALTLDGEIAFIVHPEGLDFTVIEQYVLASLAHETGITLDLSKAPSGEIPGAAPLFLKKQPAPQKQLPNYFKHDRTKSHGRRRR